MSIHRPDPVLAGELAPLVGVPDVGRAARDSDGIPVGLDAEARVHRRGHLPRKDRPRVPVHDRRQIDVPLVHRNVGIAAKRR